MLAEMKASHDPLVYVDLEAPQPLLQLVVGNSGQSAAIGIEFSIEDNIPWKEEEYSSAGALKIPAIRSGISYLPPGRTLKWNIGIPDWDKLREKPCRLKVQVSYKSETGDKPINKKYEIDLAQYDRVLHESFRDPRKQVADAVGAIVNQMEKRNAGYSYTSQLSSINKHCPMCAEIIPVAAKKCSHCGEFVDDKRGTDEVKGNPTRAKTKTTAGRRKHGQTKKDEL